jgi:CxC5 like cysteine cluster associated with KDZ transposases
MSKMLGLYCYDKNGCFEGKLQSIAPIKPIYMLCPDTMECETLEYNPRSLLQATQDCDIPRVTLIKGSQIYDDAYVLTGICPDCNARYFADHERAVPDQGQTMAKKLYLNSAKYLKVGQHLWVDRIFSGAVINGMYSFHGSASAYAEFWNESFWRTQDTRSKKISHRQIWHTFIQESLRSVAMASNHNLVLADGLHINAVTKEAFTILGKGGIIRSADNHSCSECTHPYKHTADTITGEDPAALVGIDENRAVPALMRENAHLAVQDAAQARQYAHQQAVAMDQDNSDIEFVPIKMVVMDGIVMGNTVCLKNLVLISYYTNINIS